MIKSPCLTIDLENCIIVTNRSLVERAIIYKLRLSIASDSTSCQNEASVSSLAKKRYYLIV